LAPVLWALLNFIKAMTGTYGGGLSDRIGRKPLIIGGWLVYAAVYLAFGLAHSAWQAWALFAVYGVFYGMTEGTEKAMVVDMVPSQRKGTALGWYNLAIGIGALPASLIFGTIWDRAGAPASFMFGAGVALLASIGMVFVNPRSGARPQA
jgi:MFS family permease